MRQTAPIPYALLAGLILAGCSSGPHIVAPTAEYFSGANTILVNSPEERAAAFTAAIQQLALKGYVMDGGSEAASVATTTWAEADIGGPNRRVRFSVVVQDAGAGSAVSIRGEYQFMDIIAGIEAGGMGGSPRDETFRFMEQIALNLAEQLGGSIRYARR